MKGRARLRNLLPDLAGAEPDMHGDLQELLQVANDNGRQPILDSVGGSAHGDGDCEGCLRSLDTRPPSGTWAA
jgi:hypothetical protein